MCQHEQWAILCIMSCKQNYFERLKTQSSVRENSLQPNREFVYKLFISRMSINVICFAYHSSTSFPIRFAVHYRRWKEIQERVKNPLKIFRQDDLRALNPTTYKVILIWRYAYSAGQIIVFFWSSPSYSVTTKYILLFTLRIREWIHMQYSCTQFNILLVKALKQC